MAKSSHSDHKHIFALRNIHYSTLKFGDNFKVLLLWIASPFAISLPYLIVMFSYVNGHPTQLTSRRPWSRTKKVSFSVRLSTS